MMRKSHYGHRRGVEVVVAAMLAMVVMLAVVAMAGEMPMQETETAHLPHPQRSVQAEMENPQT